MTERSYAVATVLAGLVCAAVGTGCGMPGRSGGMDSDPAAVRETALAVLYEASSSADGVTRANALEALTTADPQGAGEVFLRALSDPAVAVQFVAAMAIGDVHYAPAAEKLSSMAADETTNLNVRCGVIYALYRLGDMRHMSHLGSLLFDPSPEVRANAALVMGKIGLPAAIRPLRSRLGTEQDPGVRLQVAESLAGLGEQRSYGILANYARVGEPHERVAAVQALGRTQSLRAKGTVLYAIDERQPPPLRLVAAGALAQMGDDRGYSLAMQALQKPREFTQRSYEQEVTVSEAQVQQIQSLAAMALAEMGRPAAVDPLVDLLDSPNPTLRISAARTALILLNRLAPEQTADPVSPAQPAASRQVVAEQPVDDAPDRDPEVLRTAPMKD